jgi:hypothetical protein
VGLLVSEQQRTKGKLTILWVGSEEDVELLSTVSAWSRSTVELQLLLLLLLLLRLMHLELPLLELLAIAPILLLLWSMQLTPRWGIHHAILGRSIARTTTAR